MRNKIAAALAIIVLCCLLIACGVSRLNRIIAAVEESPVMVDTLKLSSDTKARVNAGFAATAVCLRAYRDDKGASALQTCIAGVIARGDFVVEDPDARARIGAILAIVRVIVGIPATSVAGPQGVPPASGRAVEMTDEQVRELEALLRP